jgi:ATP-binding cassette subfamily B protein
MDLILILSIVGVVFISLVPPQILKYIIDSCILSYDSDKLLKMAILYILVFAFIGLFEFIKESILTILGQKITTEIRSEMMEKLEKINSKYFSSNESGAVVSRFVNDVDAVNSMFTSGIIGMVVDCFKIIGIIISILIFSSTLAIITLALLPVIYFITRLFQRRMLKAQIKSRVIVGKVNNHIAESLKNIQMIKSFGIEGYMEKKYTENLQNNYLTNEKVNFYDSIFSPIIQIIRAIVIGFIVILATNKLGVVGISVGMVAASIELISNLFSPIENLGMELQDIQQAISGVYRINEFYSIEEDDRKNQNIDIQKIIADRDSIIIEFKELAFNYQEGIGVLKGISIKINPMEKVAFIGRTGVGKSTLFKLVMGLLKPSSGSVKINGIDTYDILNEYKRKIFGYVPQSFSAINGTVADQITLFDRSITRKQVEEVIEFVGLTQQIASLENGLDTLINKGSYFSEGQKQLLSIARAIVTKPPILLLDEMTANVDSITEKRIVAVLERASKSHTILSVSHRLSSMLASDRVVILEEGEIKSIGKPDELLKQDEWYNNHLALEKMTWV